MSTSLFSKTPSIIVTDNRGLNIREIEYYRHPNAPNVTDERITHHQYNNRGFLSRSSDPRLYALEQAGGQIKPNFTYLTSLNGEVLQTKSVDAGTSVTLNDVIGQPFLLINNFNDDDRNNVLTRSWQYEDTTLLRRLLSVTEQTVNGTSYITERLVWARHSQIEKDLNLVGQCIRHYDTTGLRQTDSIALNGVPLSVTRQLLKNADDVAKITNWYGENASSWNNLLSSESYTTLTVTDTTGAVLTTTDAKGHIQRMAYDVAGLLKSNWLVLKGGEEQVIIKSLTYSAAGQKLREEHGNGIVTIYTYEPETQFLIRIETKRPLGHAAGKKLLQNLRYEYDPVGNVVKVTNDAEATRFWRNQKVVPENTYVYDSLYQLVSATGREMANIGQQNRTLSSTLTPLFFDDSSYVQWNRSYTYDNGGNLIQIRHSAPATNNNYTTNITVSDYSNRAVLDTLTENPAQVDNFFTVSGLQKQLQPGQSLVWTLHGELQQVMPVVRNGQFSDSEIYRYNADSQRALKITIQKAGNISHEKRVVYLPGLELCITQNGAILQEDLQMITIGAAGRAQVRILHWESGKPEDIDNNQIRYSYDNLIGSSCLEVDGNGNIISQEEYYPYGGTALWIARSQIEANYKVIRYSGKERDVTGLYYYGYRYYQSWAGRWLSVDPAGAEDGLNLFRMVRNNPVTFFDPDGNAPQNANGDYYYHISSAQNLHSFLQKGFIPQGSKGPTLSGEDLLKREKGIIRSIYRIISSKTRQFKTSHILTDSFWEKFKEGYADVFENTDVNSVGEKLKAIAISSFESVGKNAFRQEKGRSTEIDEQKMRILIDPAIKRITEHRAMQIQQEEENRNQGYIYLAASTKTLEKYVSYHKDNALVILAIRREVFSQEALEKDMQEPDDAMRYKGSVSANVLNFVNKHRKLVSISPSEESYESVRLNAQEVMDFIHLGRAA